MTSREIRQQFLDFFKSKQHTIVPSAPVVPFDDPTLLFTNAGMNQFKDVFLATGSRSYTRAADTQKCIRVSGKHNDLEEVGHDTYHHTFFEMLGNWSFGDYYKKEAIRWAWELLTEVWKLPKDRLYATIYRTDEEALELWKSETDIKHSHILKFDEKDNFWEMGETGPCGPCSEIHINLSDNPDDPSLVNAGSPLCMEIWNLVFIQYNRDENGKLHELPAKHVDTGMGFERVTAVLQGKNSNYDTDVFMPLINAVSHLSNVKYEKEEDQIPMRVIADHIRTLAYAIADGAVPGNEGRGYVLRRILRRASRYGRKLGLKEPFLYKLVDILSETMGDVFPEIVSRQDHVKRIIKAEEESFNRTLDKGISLFEQIATEMKKQGKNVIPGEDAFKLYDTFGFPVDLTRVMALELGMSVDETGFEKLMEEQKSRAREASKEKFASVSVNLTGLDGFALSGAEQTVFTGYEDLTSHAVIKGVKTDDEAGYIILDKTPFYVEAGGQIDDTGIIKVAEYQLEVVDVAKIEGKTVHAVKNESGALLEPGIEITASVDRSRRYEIMRNHTATHLMHSALRKILGTHVGQAGSYVGPDRLRFDFTHFSKVSHNELMDIEAMVNDYLLQNIPLQHHRNVPFDEAKKMGALMFFGDKYGDFVNVVQYGDYSVEFCGGTHVRNSSEIGLFKIISESSISSGVRRIEAVTGLGVERWIRHQIEKEHELESRILELTDTRKKLEKEINDLKLKEKLSVLPALMQNPQMSNGVAIYTGMIDDASVDDLKFFGDEFRNRMKDGVGLLASVHDGKVGLVCIVSDALIKEKKLSAGKLVGDIAKQLGGGGGGKPHLATAGAKDTGKVGDVLRQFPGIVSGYLA
ncbi:MAG: alanine--tRNA ligase [Ignavibacteriales bacterium]